MPRSLLAVISREDGHVASAQLSRYFGRQADEHPQVVYEERSSQE